MNKIIIVKKIALSLFLVFVALLLFVQFQTLNKYALNIKESNYYILIISSVVCSLMSTVCLFKWQMKLSVADIAVFVFMLYSVVNSYFNTSLESHEFRMMLSYGVIYLSFRLWFVNYRPVNDYVIIAILLAGLYQSILSIRQIYGLEFSNHSQFFITGSFFNPGPCGVFICAVATLALHEIKRSTKIFDTTWTLTDYMRISVIKTYLAYITFISIFVVIVPTMSRAGWLGIIIALTLMYRRNIVIMTKMVAKRCKVSRNSVYLTLLVIALLFAGLMYMIKAGSANGRLFIWQNVCSVIWDNLLFGVGVDGFAEHYSLAQSEYFTTHDALTVHDANIDVVGVPEYTFNELLSVWMWLGLVGLVLVLIVFIKKIRAGLSEDSGLIYMGVSILVSSMFTYTFYIPVTTILFLIALASVHEVKTVKISRGVGLTIFGVIISFNIVLNRDIGNELYGYYQWRGCKMFYSMQDYESSVDEYSGLLHIFKNNPTFMFEYGHSLNKVGEYEKSNVILREGMRHSTDPMFWTIIGNNHLGLKEYDLSEMAYLKSYYLCPNRLYPLFQLTKLGAEQGNRNVIEYYGNLLLEKRPKVNTEATADMKQEISEMLINLKDKINDIK